MRTLIAVFLFVLCAGPVHGQPLFEVGVDTGGSSLYWHFDVIVGVPFTVAVDLHTDGSDLAAVEFVLDELTVLAPGVFKLDTTLIQPEFTLDLGDNSVGEYMLELAECETVTVPTRLVAIRYGDFAGSISNDVVLSLRGFAEGDSRPSNFGGQPGYRDCSGIGHPGTMGGHGEICTGIGVIGDEGALVLNPTPTPCPAGENSLGAVKCRYGG